MMNLSRIKGLRVEKGLTQVKFAKELQLSRNSYALYETGKREIPVDVLIQIVNYFNVSIDYLVCRTDNRRIVK